MNRDHTAEQKQTDRNAPPHEQLGDDDLADAYGVGVSVRSHRAPVHQDEQ